jgi:mono/diheme cytochrome c family protein
MRSALKGALLALVALAAIATIAAVAFVRVTGLSARAEPGALETAVARRLRALAVPGEYRERQNPVARSAQSIRNGMEHFADHCAVCHANNGSGETEMGKGMFPPAPDMRLPATQELGDGALYYVIEHGVRFTGMPAWSTGTSEGEESSWHLVNFIRHLPHLTAAEEAEMSAMNPRPPAEIRQEIEEERFLAGEDPLPPRPGTAHGH